MYSYAYRLYPSRRQVEALAELLEFHRELYNAAIEERREAWRRLRVSINYFVQANQLKEIRRIRPEFAQFNHSACQQTLRRVSKSFQAFFQRIQAGRTPGYPRFKSSSRFNSVVFVFGDGATRRNDRLKVQGVGAIKVKWHRPFPPGAIIKQVVLHRKLDIWYATFQIDSPDRALPRHDGGPIGIDLGLKHLIGLSNGELIDAPQYFRKAERQLRRQQRRMCRRVIHSRGWRDAVKQVAKTYAHIARQRKDHAHKLSRRLADKYSLIAVEDLHVQGLSQTNRSKSVFDAGWAQLLAMIDYKVVNTGSHIVRVNPRFTSQICSACGSNVKKDLNVRMHICPHCGLSLDRDVNAARNILYFALESLGRSVGSETWAVAPSVLSAAAPLGAESSP